MKFFALSLLGASLLMAQQTTAPPPRGRFGPRAPGVDFETRLTRTLGLTAQQQNTVHTALAERDVISKGNMPQMRTLRTSLVTAIKAGNEDQIDQLSQQISVLSQQESAVRAKAMAKIYAALTPAQQAKVGPNLEMLMGGRPGFRGGPGRRTPPPANATQAPAVQ